MPAPSRIRVDQTVLDPLLNGAARRAYPLRVLFYGESGDAELCMQELERAHLKAAKDVALTPGQFGERLRSKLYDIIVTDYDAAKSHGTQVMELLQKMETPVPLVYITHNSPAETMAKLITKGAADCIQMENVGHLPAAIFRVLRDKKLREQRDHAVRRLRHSQARYRTLVGNLTYGLCRWNLEGRLLDVNPALMTMLGYTSKKELMAEDLTRTIFCDPLIRNKILGCSGFENRVGPAEIDWKRRDGTTVKVRLRGRAVQSERGKIEGYEVIVEDVTNQRELEDNLRDQATKDSLTGLANYRRFVDVLDSEIKRSGRTAREFALLLFDLDHLKVINDRYGHVMGSQALCRLADVLSISCRDIDTAARFGGDEFALILPETGAEAAKVVAQRICSTLAGDGGVPNLSVSVGAAIYPQDGEAIESLLSAADLALYGMKAKRTTPDHQERGFHK